MLKNWKTTAWGLMGAVFLFGYKFYFALPIDAHDVAIAGALFGIGSQAKDKDK